MAMSCDQLLALLRQAEHSSQLRQQLRFSGDWHAWVLQARRLGYAVTLADLQEARAAERMSAFLGSSQLQAIRPLV